jgi:uncharacterized protein (UPF0371 family)
MSNQIGFDNQKYLETQSARIQNRIAQFGGKLYLEFGGKLFDDNHAVRVLPGFVSDSKLRILLKLRKSVEMLIVINASAIEQNKLRGDLGIPYDEDVLRLIDTFRGMGLYVGSVTITQYAGQPSADAFKQRLETLGVTVYLHYPIPGYPHDVGRIVSDDGFGRNDYIETTRPLVVVTAPGPGSGKMATCLSQLYHHHKRGVPAGYAKFETFPIWNLPLKHPVNLAYEAATADLNDINMIDPFHLQAYGETTVNYNRDVEVFPVLQAMFEEIMGESPYKSPTDMGVNMAGHCIIDDDAVCAAARREIVRRYYSALCDRRKGQGSDEIVYKLELLMKQAQAGPELRPVIAAAEEREEQTGEPAVAIRLPDDRVVTGGTSDLMGAASAALLNAMKALAGIDHGIHLISRAAIEPIQQVKVGYLGSRNPRLHSDEVLIALAGSTAMVPLAAQALESLDQLRQCEAHSSVILTAADSSTYSKLGLRLTCTPKYQSNQQLYHK